MNPENHNPRSRVHPGQARYLELCNSHFGGDPAEEIAIDRLVNQIKNNTPGLTEIVPSRVPSQAQERDGLNEGYLGKVLGSYFKNRKLDPSQRASEQLQCSAQSFKQEILELIRNLNRELLPQDQLQASILGMYHQKYQGVERILAILSTRMRNSDQAVFRGQIAYENLSVASHGHGVTVCTRFLGELDGERCCDVHFLPSEFRAQVEGFLAVTSRVRDRDRGSSMHTNPTSPASFISLSIAQALLRASVPPEVALRPFGFAKKLIDSEHRQLVACGESEKTAWPIELALADNGAFSARILNVDESQSI